MPPSVAAIIRQVADEHCVSPQAILGDRRLRHLVRARRAAIRRVQQEVVWRKKRPSLSQLGRWFGRDHSTIRQALYGRGPVSEDRRERRRREREGREWSALRARLEWSHGSELADDIIAGRHPTTNADIAAWRGLGKRRTAA